MQSGEEGMLIAIISDIHANLPALEAVLVDIKSRDVKQVYCLGDLVDFAPWGNEVIDRIRQEGIPCLLGNHDERIAFSREIIPLAKHSEEESIARKRAISHSMETITVENKAFLGSLPYLMQLTFRAGGKDWNLQLMHASMNSNEEYCYEDDPDEVFLNMLDKSAADILLMGHTHLSFVKELAGKLIVNCGSVGRSKEYGNLASYVLLEIHPEAVSAKIIQLDFDRQKVVNAIRQSAIPDFYADFWLKDL